MSLKNYYRFLCYTALGLMVGGTLQDAEAGPPGDESGDIQYILFNYAPGVGMYQGNPESLGRESLQEVLERFPNRPGAKVRTGVSYNFSVFRTAPEVTVKALRNFLTAAAQTATPVLIQFDTEHWWQARPDLWNWWDPEKPGFDPANRANVEWTGWSENEAIKLAWLNWGRQIRVLPPPNLASPRYTAACREELQRFIPIVLEWYGALPEAQKNLFVGIKLGHETSIGLNGFHYPGGNELLNKPEADDPKSGIDTKDVISRGVAGIGHAAVKTSGIRSSGKITESDLRDVAQKYLEMLSSEAAKLGVPRARLFTHGAGWEDGELIYDAAVNPYACPGWSFYRHAGDPSRDEGVQRNLKRSDAPYWAATEWFFGGPRKTAAWRIALEKTLADKRCRYVCIFNWQSIRASDPVLKGIEEVVAGSDSAGIK